MSDSRRAKILDCHQIAINGPKLRQKKGNTVGTREVGQSFGEPQGRVMF
jgi:hypothetical protein